MLAKIPNGLNFLFSADNTFKIAIIKPIAVPITTANIVILSVSISPEIMSKVNSMMDELEKDEEDKRD